MHRAGVDRTLDSRFGFFRPQVSFRLKIKPGFAFGVAKQVTLILVVGKYAFVCRHRHAANGILVFHGSGRVIGVRMRMVWLLDMIHAGFP
jgi:hypothetical protein